MYCIFFQKSFKVRTKVSNNSKFKESLIIKTTEVTEFHGEKTKTSGKSKSLLYKIYGILANNEYHKKINARRVINA